MLRGYVGTDFHGGCGCTETHYTLVVDSVMVYSAEVLWIGCSL